MRPLALFAASLLLALTGAALPLVGQAREGCRVTDPLTVHALFDNTTTVVDSIPAFAQDSLADRIFDVVSWLRPGDSLEVHGFAFSRSSMKSLSDGRSIARTANPGRDRVEARRAAAGLLSEPVRTDLRRALADFIEMKSPCVQVLLLVTDGSLDVDDSDGPERAIAQLEAQVQTLRGAGWAIFVLHLRGAREPLAFDDHYRAGFPETFRDRQDLDSLSAGTVLRRVFGRENVESWSYRGAVRSFLYEAPDSPLARRGLRMSPRLGITPGDLRRSAVDYFMYRQGREAVTSDTSMLRGCAMSPMVREDHLVVGTRDDCLHILIEPDDGLLSSRVLDGLEWFGWHANPSLVAQLPNSLIHISQVKASTLVELPGGCPSEPLAGDEYFAPRRGTNEYVLVRARFVAQPERYVTDTLFPLLRHPACFRSRGTVITPDAVVNQGTGGIHLQFEHYVDGGPRARAHEWLDGRLAALAFDEIHITRVLPFELFKRQVFYARGSLQVPETFAYARLQFGAGQIPLNARDGGCGRLYGGMKCVGFSAPVYERTPENRGVLYVSSERNADCVSPTTTCAEVIIPLPPLIIRPLTGAWVMLGLSSLGVLFGIGMSVRRQRATSEPLFATCCFGLRLGLAVSILLFLAVEYCIWLWVRAGSEPLGATQGFVLTVSAMLVGWVLLLPMTLLNFVKFVGRKVARG